MLKRIVKEPIVYFVILGVMIYTLYVPEVTEEALTAEVIDIPNRFVEEQSDRFRSKYSRSPSEDELAGLLDQAISDEVLFREAWRLKLFVGDDIVRKRMIQKMRYILEEDEHEEVSESEIDKRLQELSKRAEPTTQFGLYHIAFSDYDKAQTYHNQITQNPEVALERPEGMIAFPLGNVFAQISLEESKRMFGGEFSDQLRLDADGQWQSPIKSRYGYHVVKIDNVRTTEASLDEGMRDLIRKDIHRQKLQERKREALDELKARYVIAYTD